MKDYKNMQCLLVSLLIEARVQVIVLQTMEYKGDNSGTAVDQQQQIDWF